MSEYPGHEAGILREVRRESFTTGGQNVHILLTTQTNDNNQEPATKRAKADLSLSASASSG
jgi:hypothetical protein